MLKSLLHFYFLGARALTIGVRAAIISSDRRVVLVRHPYTRGWHFPGGGVERNETCISALRREILQEVGISQYSEPELFGVYFNGEVSKRDHVVLFKCNYDGPVPRQPPSWEISEVALFSIEALPSDTDPGTRRRVREIQSLSSASCEW